MKKNLRAAKADAEAANLAKSEFLANMSHEIRTPLTAILGFAEMLELDGDMEAAPKSRVDAVRTIRCNGDHLLQIIDDILDLSKMEKLGEIRTEPCNLRATIDHAIDSFRPLANPGVEFLVECPGSARAPVILHTSPVRLRQILLNLVGNAVKFTDEGFIKVAVAVGGRRLTINVEDTGSGMEIGQAKELFAPFRRPGQLRHPQTRRNGTWTGDHPPTSRENARQRGDRSG